MPSLYEIKANLSWYERNSNFFDPVYLYMQKQYAIAKAASAYTYKMSDANIIIDNSTILRYGSFECHQFGKQAYMDSWLSCMIFQLPFFLETIQFGYICYAIIIPIMLISLFGGIKESYRWFLLNQAIWDMLICYDFICEKPTILSWSNVSIKQSSTCFYHRWPESWFLNALSLTIRNSVRFLPFTGTLLLTFSRFICVYFPIFYQRHATKSLKIIIFILVFDILFILLINANHFVSIIVQKIMLTYTAACYTDCNPNCTFDNDQFFHCLYSVFAFMQKWINVTDYGIYFISPVIFLLVTILAVFLFTKIGWQVKYQLQHQKSSVATSLRIASVVAFQCGTMTVSFILMSIQSYALLQQFYNFGDYTIYKSMSPLLFLLQNYATTTSFNMIRVFFDSLIILIVLSGYRKKLFEASKFIFLCCFKPRDALIKLKTKLEKYKSQITFNTSVQIL